MTLVSMQRISTMERELPRPTLGLSARSLLPVSGDGVLRCEKLLTL